MRIAALVATAMFLSVGSAPGNGAEADQRAVSLATGGVGGVYHPLGTAMAQIWSRDVEDLDVTPEPSFASVANMLLLQAGEADMAFVQNDIASFSYNAKEMFALQPSARNSRGVAMLYPEPIQIVTLAGAGIASVDDLVGKRVAIGAVGSGTEINARQILEVHDISPRDDLSAYNLQFREAMAALQANLVQAAFVTAGVPTGAVRDLDRTYVYDVAIVPIAPEKIDTLVGRWPHFSRTTIPAGTYAGVHADVPTVGVWAMLVANAEVNPDLVQRMLEVLYRDETLQALCSIHESACTIARATGIEGMPIPLHPGARNFFKPAAGVAARQ